MQKFISFQSLQKFAPSNLGERAKELLKKSAGLALFKRLYSFHFFHKNLFSLLLYSWWTVNSFVLCQFKIQLMNLSSLFKIQTAHFNFRSSKP
ncbi:hypothetical protein A4A49_35514 [Nicotiana attenuata]|uniref:Uncharacterized protein n=1 Tax=Nicotiana attenuata TaxID=49451 RepID=A0A314KYJ9_NICAT|nr:hypothetical protein A4A49_35514 [Nicotiana attenuata]